MVQGALDISRRSFDLSIEMYQFLAGRRLVTSELERYVRSVFHIPETATESRILDGVLRSHEEGRGADIPGVRGTYWGAYNAVTDYLDHVRGRTDETRLDSSWFGAGRAIRDRALELALAS